jgi:hypothetical protein
VIENPWLTFNPLQDAPKFHEHDAAFVQAFNKGMNSGKIKAKADYLLAEHLEPFPYLGNPSANVFVLMANPGVSKEEKKKSFKMHSEKLAQNRRNLRHEDSDSIKSRIDSPDRPELESIWLKPRVRELVEKTSAERVARGIFLVNFHAYHSKSWHSIPVTFPTQHYSFSLISEAIKREAVIIVGRNKLGWVTAIPGLFEYKESSGNVIEFDSKRSIYISKGNLNKKSDTAFERILEKI